MESGHRSDPSPAGSHSFASLLRHFRLAAGLTQEELAERAGLSARAISDLERGTRRMPRRDTVELLSGALELSHQDRAVLESSVPKRRGPGAEGEPEDMLSVLPAWITPLVGRERHEAEAVHLLGQEGTRLLTLTGPGGVGKTRLAIQVAASLQHDVVEAAVFVPLAPIAHPDLVLPAIAAALGVRESPGRPLFEGVATRLRSRGILLVLDNFEHLLDAASVVADLLGACPDLKILATSRAPLHLRWEQELDVPPLALPDPEDQSVAALARSPAVALFLQRARAVKPDFVLTPNAASAVSDLCRQVDGLPLAIELAAARVKVLPPRALLNLFPDRLRILTDGPRDLPARQQTMRDAIGWSYDLLRSEEQTLFRRLAVFAGGCATDAVEAICTVEGDGEMDTIKGLTVLVDNSLLDVTDSGPEEDFRPRFRMLETVREFGVSLLRERGESVKIRRRHAVYFLAMAEAARNELQGPGQSVLLTRLQRESGNLQAALQWAFEEGEVEIGLRTATSLWRFWSILARYAEGRGWLERLIALDETGGMAVPQPLRARALNQAGRFASRQGDYQRAVSLGEKELALCLDAGDKAGVASALQLLGDVAQRRNDYAGSVPLLEESLALRREIGDSAGIASVLNLLGGDAQHRGHIGRAEALFGEALTIYRQVGDTMSIAHMLYRLGDIAASRAEFEEATRLYEESLELRRGLGDKEGIGFALNGLALVAHVRGEYGRAMAIAEESLSLFRSVAVKQYITLVLETLARIVLDAGDDQRALDLFREGLSIASEIGYKDLIAYHLEGLARIAGRAESPEQAVRLLGTAACLREATEARLIPYERGPYDRFVEAMRTTLGAEKFQTAWDAGRAMPLGDAITSALRTSARQTLERSPL